MSTGSLTAPLETDQNKEPEHVNYSQESVHQGIFDAADTHTLTILYVGRVTVASWICMTRACKQSHTQTAVISPGSCSESAVGGFVRVLV